MNEYIYFISDGEYIKIGKSISPLRRLKELQTANGRALELIGIIPSSKVNENVLHSVFGDSHVRGEWFEIDSSILSFIDYHKEEDLEKNFTDNILAGIKGHQIKPEYAEYIELVRNTVV